MEANQQAALAFELRQALKLESDISLEQFEQELDMALYHTRTAGLDNLDRFEKLLRSLDLAQIGYILLSNFGEAQHGSWDGHSREDLVALNHVLEDWCAVFELHIQADDLETDAPWTFGGPEHWDASGKRHVDHP